MRSRSRRGYNVLQQLRLAMLDCMTYKLYKLSRKVTRLREDIEVRKFSLIGSPNRKLFLRFPWKLIRMAQRRLQLPLST
jgi:hypothetical protein